MQPVTEVRAELEQLAQLPALARRRESLQHLASNLDTDEAHLWAKVDLYSAFGPDSIEVPASRELTNRAGWVELARNLLIMAPLLITWIGVSLATNAYGEMLREDPSAARSPFIALWESGFDGRTAATLFRVAVADVIAFITVIGCSLWLSWLRRKIDVTVEAEERVTWNRLREALLEASLHLNRRAFDTPARFNEELTRAMITLGGVTEQIDEVGQRASTALEQISTSVETLGDHSVTFSTGVAAQREALETLDGSLGTTATELTGLCARLDALASGLGAAVSSQETLTERLETGLGEVAQATQQQATTVSIFMSEVQAERGRQSELVAAWSRATAAATSAADALSSAASTAEGTAGDLQGAASTLSTTSQSLGDLLADITPRLEAAGASLSDVARALPSAITEAGARLHSATEGVVERSAAAASSTEQAMDALQATTSAVSADLRHATESLSTAIDRLAGVAAELQRLVPRDGAS